MLRGELLQNSDRKGQKGPIRQEIMHRIRMSVAGFEIRKPSAVPD
jgi:hypothetical protein